MTMERINKISSYFKSKAKKDLEKKVKKEPPKKKKPWGSAFFGKGGVREKIRKGE